MVYTGTGKTLSIICSCLQWLVDKKQKNQVSKPGSNLDQIEISEDDHISDDEPDWMRNFTLNEVSNTPQDKSKIKTNKKAKERGKGEKGCNGVTDIFSQNGVEGEDNADKREMKVSKLKSGVEEIDDKEFLVEDYESEGEMGISKKRGVSGCSVDSSSEEEEGENGCKEEKEEEARLKIYFCSRTHSQLSQFIKELRKTKFATELKVVSLGSRKNFCINEGISVNCLRVSRILLDEKYYFHLQVMEALMSIC